MLLRPNPTSGVPIYVQLMDQVKRGLETGVFRPGDTLPEVHPLAESLVVNPNAVARAYRELESEGVVTREQGVTVRLKAGASIRPTPTSLRNTTESLKTEIQRLSAQVAADAADRAKRNYEIETASEVQRRLLPQSAPAINGVDCAGVSRPALGVGGDYYDFIELGGDRLGIALGDVSGKGMPAALLMSALRAYLHGQTHDGQTEPVNVMATLNQRVFESSAANRFATFFYARYDATTRTLDYVNAGHNAPFVVRRHDDRTEIVRLEPGGMAIGMMPDSTYTPGRILLEPGDVMVAFSDGITDAMNPDGDEWGDGRLAALVEHTTCRAAHHIVEHVFGAVDAFVADAPQYDDMTLIAVRIL